MDSESTPHADKLPVHGPSPASPTQRTPPALNRAGCADGAVNANTLFQPGHWTEQTLRHDEEVS